MKPQSRPLAGIALATALVAAAAQAPAAGPGPLDLLAPPKSAAPDGVGAGVPKPPRKPADAATVGSIKPLTAAEVIRKADAWLNKTRYLYAEFTQIGADGMRNDGQLYLDRPGRMSFSYNPPSPMEVVADGTSVAVRNRKLGTQDLYLVRQTPLKFLLADKVDLAKDVKVLSVSTDPQNPSVLIEDHRTLGGTSRVRLAFDPADFALKQWTVIDPQGYKTVVSLDKTVVGVKPDAKLFVIRAQPRQ